MSERRLPDGMTPRLLGEDAAAAYCGVSAAHFREHLAPVVRPIHIGRRKLWDVRALDRWLDLKSGLAEPVQSTERWLEALDGDPLEGR
jgi:hypothetical protein